MAASPSATVYTNQQVKSESGKWTLPVLNDRTPLDGHWGGLPMWREPHIEYGLKFTWQLRKNAFLLLIHPLNHLAPPLPIPLPELLNHHLDPATWGRSHKEPPVGRRPDCNIWIWNGPGRAWKQPHALRHRPTPRREALLGNLLGPGGSFFTSPRIYLDLREGRERRLKSMGWGGGGVQGEAG